MCAVSAVGDDWSRRGKWPGHWPFPESPWPPEQIPITTPERGSSFRIGQLENKLEKQQDQIAEIKKLVLEMKAELEAAKAQDVAEGNPDCEMEDKVIVLRRIAEIVGESLDRIFPNEKGRV